MTPIPLAPPLSAPISEPGAVALGILGFFGLPVLGGVMMSMGLSGGALALPVGLCLGAVGVLALPASDAVARPDGLLDADGLLDVDG